MGVLRTFSRSKVVVVLFMSLLLIGVGIGIFYFVLSDHTIYAQDFSRTNFALICPGLSETRVNMLIGAPLQIDVGPFGEVWYYGSQWPLSLNGLKTRGLIITFRLDGTVADTMGKPQAVGNMRFHAGATATDVLKEAGVPTRIEPPFHKKAWYSRPRGDAVRYSLFAVIYDRNGTVLKTEERWDFD